MDYKKLADKLQDLIEKYQLVWIEPKGIIIENIQELISVTNDLQINIEKLTL